MVHYSCLIINQNYYFSKISVVGFIYIKIKEIINIGLLWWLRCQRICLQCRRPGFSPGWEGPLEEGMAKPLQDSCLENAMDRGACWATVHAVAELDMTE